MPHCSIVGLVPRQHHALGLYFNHLQLSRSIPPHTTIHCIHTLHLRPAVHRVENIPPPYPYPPPPVCGSSDGNAPTPYPYPPPLPYAYPPYSYPPPQPVVHRVVLLLNHINTLYLRYIHTLHLNLFTLEVVTTQVAGRIHLIQLKLLQG
jgi:hypothetical protein